MNSIGFLRIYSDQCLDYFEVGVVKKVYSIIAEIGSPMGFDYFFQEIKSGGPLVDIKFEGQPLLLPFFEKLIKIRKLLKPHGVTFSSINVQYNYYRQCSLGFSPEELRFFSQNSLALMIDCWIQNENT